MHDVDNERLQTDAQVIIEYRATVVGELVAGLSPTHHIAGCVVLVQQRHIGQLKRQFQPVALQQGLANQQNYSLRELAANPAFGLLLIVVKGFPDLVSQHNIDHEYQDLVSAAICAVLLARLRGP